MKINLQMDKLENGLNLSSIINQDLNSLFDFPEQQEEEVIKIETNNPIFEKDLDVVFRANTVSEELIIFEVSNRTFHFNYGNTETSLSNVRGRTVQRALSSRSINENQIFLPMFSGEIIPIYKEFLDLKLKEENYQYKLQVSNGLFFGAVINKRSIQTYMFSEKDIRKIINIVNRRENINSLHETIVRGVANREPFFNNVYDNRTICWGNQNEELSEANKNFFSVSSTINGKYKIYFNTLTNLFFSSTFNNDLRSSLSLNKTTSMNIFRQMINFNYELYLSPAKSQEFQRLLIQNSNSIIEYLTRNNFSTHEILMLCTIFDLEFKDFY